MGKDLLVLSDRSIRRNHTTHLTYRLVLPIQHFSSLSTLIGQDIRIWWAERHRSKIYLKACLADCKIFERTTKDSYKQFVAVGKIDESNYIYRDIPICPIDANINANHNVGYWQLIELDQQQADNLSEHSANVSPIVLSLKDAISVNKRSLLRCWPRGGEKKIHPRRLLRTFKTAATLSELVRVKGLDPYETSVVTALMDIGAGFSVKTILQLLYDKSGMMSSLRLVRDSIRLQAPTFTQVGLLPNDLAWRGHSSSTPVKKWADEFSFNHEVIVAALARRLRSMGLTPCVSPLVDLALIDNGSALFFEVKTVNNGNLLDQVRSAIGQLLEYRFVYRDVFNSIQLAVVAPALGSLSELAYVKEFIRDCGIDWVLYDSTDLHLDFPEGLLSSLSPSTNVPPPYNSLPPGARGFGS